MNTDFTPIVRALEHLAATQQKEVWDYIATIAVVLTLFVLIFYTRETYRLRKAAEQQTSETGKLLEEAHRQNEATIKLVSEASRQNEAAVRLWNEAQRQNEFSVMPLLAILLDLPELRTSSQMIFGRTRRLVLRNVGNGPAFNVFIEPQSVDGKVLEFESERAALTHGEERTLKIHFEPQPDHGIMGTPDSLYEWINTGELPDPLQVVVRCRSVTSIDYWFMFRFTPKAGRLNVVYEGYESSRQAPLATT